MRTFILSLKYSPGLFKEFILLYDKFIEYGSVPHLLISEHYKSSFESSPLNKSDYSHSFLTKSRDFKGVIMEVLRFPLVLFGIRSLLSTAEKSDSCLFFFYNSHPLNVLIQSYLRLFFKNVKIATVLHEPYVPKDERSHFGTLRALYIVLILWVQNLSVKLSHHIITVSPNGGNLFLRYFDPYKEKLIQSSILFRNPSQDVGVTKKSSVCMVGTMNQNKGLVDFIKLINYVIGRGKRELTFKIITSSNIETYVNQLNDGWEEYLEVISKPYITDKEIDEVIKESRIVCVLHTTASKSGVMPLAIKHNTPVLCRDISAFNQFLSQSDMLLSRDFSSKEFFDKINVLLTDWDEYSGITQEIFSKYFSEDNFKEYYKKLIKHV